MKFLKRLMMGHFIGGAFFVALSIIQGEKKILLLALVLFITGVYEAWLSGKVKNENNTSRHLKSYSYLSSILMLLFVVGFVWIFIGFDFGKTQFAITDVISIILAAIIVGWFIIAWFRNINTKVVAGNS